MKCDICNVKIEKTFLGKIIGTYLFKDKKKFVVCPNCQKANSKQELIDKL